MHSYDKMPGVSETFVDLTYRGLPLGRRIKLTRVRPTTGYLEVPAPMPVGTMIGILTDDTVALDAQVVEIHEQVGGATEAPGMTVKPKLVGDAAQSWWSARVALPEIAPKPAPPIVPPTATVRRRETAAPELVDDGQNTAVMAAVDPEQLQDDGKKTTAMDAVDLAALGLDPLSRTTAPMPTVAPADDTDPNDPPKKKRRRR